MYCASRREVNRISVVSKDDVGELDLTQLYRDLVRLDQLMGKPKQTDPDLYLSVGARTF